MVSTQPFAKCLAKPNAKQRSLLDFERFFDHVFQLANHPKPLRAEAIAKFARPALNKQPDASRTPRAPGKAGKTLRGESPLLGKA